MYGLSSVSTSHPLMHVDGDAPVVVNAREHDGAIFVSFHDERDSNGPTIVFQNRRVASGVSKALVLALEELDLVDERSESGWREASMTVFKPLDLGVGSEES